jgi:hypothetical protein
MAQERPLRGFPPTENWITVSDPVDAIVSTMSGVMDSGRIWMYTGPAQPEIYSDPRLLDFMRPSVIRGIQFKVLTGPIVVTDKDGQNSFLKLQEEGVIEDIKAKKFIDFSPPMIAVETPEPHPYGLYEENSLGRIRNRAASIDSAWHSWAMIAILRMSADGEETNPRPWLATPELFTQLKRAASKGGSFHYTTIEEFRRLPDGSQLRPYQPPQP